jgi:hypothetical protein
MLVRVDVVDRALRHWSHADCAQPLHERVPGDGAVLEMGSTPHHTSDWVFGVIRRMRHEAYHHI